MPLVDTMLSLVAPHYCLGCGIEDSVACRACMESLAPLPSRCYQCQTATPDFAVCDKCRRKSVLKHVWVSTIYDAMAKDVLHAYKFERAQSAATVLAEKMLETLPLLTGVIIVPVPTASERYRLRGYDHTKLLARHIALRARLLMLSPVHRISQSRQVGSGRKQRFLQLKHAFITANPQAVKGKHVLLVDDVVTTGATLETVAKQLKAAGARQVDAVVFAQKI